MLSLAFPWALLLLPLPWLVWRFAPPYRSRAQATRIPFFRPVTEAAGVSPHPGASILRRSRFQIAAAGLVWALILLALARPEQLGDPVVIEKSARDIVLALDVSGSMDERDFTSPDGAPQQRLAAVKSMLDGFIAERSGDRMSLIIFGTRAFVQAPFTEDLTSLSGFLEQTQAGMAGPNTALGDAIGLAIRSFEASEVEERLLLLLSDGADTSSRMTPVNAAAIAAERGVVITTIGVGDPEGSGENRVDLDLLEKIAGTTDGDYFFASDTEALQQVYSRIDAQIPRLVEQQSYRPSDSLAHIPLGLAAAIAFLATAWLHLSSQRRAAA